MNQFCKIINLKEGQVVVMMTYDDDRDESEGFYTVEQITEYNGARMSTKAGYPTEKLQEAHFETFVKEDAEKFFATAKRVLS